MLISTGNAEIPRQNGQLFYTWIERQRTFLYTFNDIYNDYVLKGMRILNLVHRLSKYTLTRYFFQLLVNHRASDTGGAPFNTA